MPTSRADTRSSKIKGAANLLRALADELESDPDFAERLLARRASRLRRRDRIKTDLYALYSKGGAELLRGAMEKLDIEDLRALVRQNGMDPSRLADKWRRKGRLVDLIVTTIEERSRMGEVFRRSQ